eukprot:6012605-Alexandrium_andersonii.AAC.1
MNQLPRDQRPEREEHKTNIDQYVPGGYRKGRLITAARIGLNVTPVWVILKNMAKGAKAEGVIVAGGHNFPS